MSDFNIFSKKEANLDLPIASEHIELNNDIIMAALALILIPAIVLAVMLVLIFCAPLGVQIIGFSLIALACTAGSASVLPSASTERRHSIG